MEIIINLKKKKMDSDYEGAIKEYVKRLTPFCRVIVKTVKLFKSPAPKKDTKLFKVCPIIDTISSVDFCRLIQTCNLNGYSRIIFYINPRPEELPECDILSVSSFDMSTELTSVVLCEQIYRAYTIMNNITYHK